jgi:hypothetical protein
MSPRNPYRYRLTIPWYEWGIGNALVQCRLRCCLAGINAKGLCLHGLCIHVVFSNIVVTRTRSDEQRTDSQRL